MSPLFGRRRGHDPENRSPPGVGRQSAGHRHDPGHQRQQWAAKGYLEDLSDVYAADVNGTAMADKIIEADRNVGKYGGKYWMVPWTDVCNGIIYNETLFAQNGWSEPKTVSEMFTLMEQMKAKGVTPFSFGGKVISYWDFPVLAWMGPGRGHGRHADLPQDGFSRGVQPAGPSQGVELF